MSELHLKSAGRQVRVEGRDDIGEVVGHHNFANTGMIRCVEVLFPADGLCAFDGVNKVIYVDSTWWRAGGGRMMLA